MHLPEAKQVFSAVSGELLFIWEVSSFLGVYSLFFYYLRIFVFFMFFFSLDFVIAALLVLCTHSKSSADDLVP